MTEPQIGSIQLDRTVDHRRRHGTTALERFAEEAPHLVPLPRHPYDTARVLYREAVALHEKSNRDDTLLAAKAHLAYGNFLLDTGEPLKAREQLQRARITAAKLLPAGSTMLADYDTALAKARNASTTESGR